jgi:Na+/pantothenate symporter
MEPSSVATGALFTFGLYTVGVFVLAWFSHRVLAKREFLSEYYLGSRGLGVIAFTLTFGATAASAGSFAGFPALIYTHGWVLALWIAGYMMVPLCTMGLFGKRINQLSRKSGCITLPDILRARFESPAVALCATLLMAVMLAFYLIPQFKLGGIILQRLFDGSTMLAASSGLIRPITAPLELEAEYVVCLLIFAAMVVAYTTYGGFRAVVWTDVMQGIVMGGGVVALLVLALLYVGGLETATREMAQMTPPRLGTAIFRTERPADDEIRIPVDQWFTTGAGESRRLFRVNEAVAIVAGASTSRPAKVVQITTPEEARRILEDAASDVSLPRGVTPEITDLRDYAFGAGEKGVYLTAPGPVPPTAAGQEQPTSSLGFLTVGSAISFFVYWTLSGAGQPGSMVRLMAFDSARTLSRSIVALTFYFGMIYFPLVIVFCAARVIVPGIDQTPDRIMPSVAFELAHWANAPWLAGLLVAVPFAAAMSTVDSFMLMISSSLVRDVYQQHFCPDASPRRIKWLSYACMTLVGAAVTLAAVNPPKFMQYLVVFAGGGLSVTFLVPMAMALYWRRSNTPGALAAMFGGMTAYLALYIGGFVTYGEARPYVLWAFDPVIWGFAASATCGMVVTLATKPPPRTLVERFFYAA